MSLGAGKWPVKKNRYVFWPHLHPAHPGDAGGGLFASSSHSPAAMCWRGKRVWFGDCVMNFDRACKTTQPQSLWHGGSAKGLGATEVATCASSVTCRFHPSLRSSGIDAATRSTDLPPAYIHPTEEITAGILGGSTPLAYHEPGRHAPEAAHDKAANVSAPPASWQLPDSDGCEFNSLQQS